MDSVESAIVHAADLDFIGLRRKKDASGGTPTCCALELKSEPVWTRGVLRPDARTAHKNVARSHWRSNSHRRRRDLSITALFTLHAHVHNVQSPRLQPTARKTVRKVPCTWLFWMRFVRIGTWDGDRLHGAPRRATLQALRQRIILREIPSVSPAANVRACHRSIVRWRRQ